MDVNKIYDKLTINTDRNVCELSFSDTLIIKSVIVKMQENNKPKVFLRDWGKNNKHFDFLKFLTDKKTEIEVNEKIIFSECYSAFSECDNMAYYFQEYKKFIDVLIKEQIAINKRK